MQCNSISCLLVAGEERRLVGALGSGVSKKPVSTNESIDRVTADLSKVGNAAMRLSLLPVPGTWYRHHCSLNICEIDSVFLTTIAYDISMVTKFPSFYSIENVTNFSPSNCKWFPTIQSIIEDYWIILLASVLQNNFKTMMITSQWYQLVPAIQSLFLIIVYKCTNVHLYLCLYILYTPPAK